MSRTNSPQWLLFFLLAAAPTAITADEPDSGTLFAKLDHDADGLLTPAEVSDEHRLLFKRLLRTGDEDRDGQLSADEFAMAIQPVRAEKESVEKQGSRLPGADALLVVLAKMDANGDQQLDAEEIPADFRAAFDRMTAAADGVAMLVLEDHIDGCLAHAIDTGQGQPYVEEVMQVVRRAVGRPMRRPGRRAARTA